MINGLEGIPGSGKSYEGVVFHVLDALRRGRKVITNLPLMVDAFRALDPSYADLLELRTRPAPIRGTWDADAAGRGEPAFVLFPDGHKEPAPSSARVFGGVWDYWSDWKSEEFGGPLFVIDECHVPLPRLGTHPHVVEWYKLHRHFNVDVLLMSQRMRGVCEEISALLGILVKVRKADILGKADHYIRKVHGGYRGAVISTDERKYRPEFFPLYKSHTQGTGMAEAGLVDVSLSIVKFKRFSRLFWVFTLAFCVWAFWPSSKAKPIPAPRAAALPAPTPIAPLPDPAGAPEPVDTDPEPLKGKLVHLTGWMRLGEKTIYSFAVSMGGQRIFDLRLVDLERSGYTFEPLGECAGMLRWKTKVFPVTCDAPVLAQGSQSVPVVIDSATGRSSVPRPAPVPVEPVDLFPG